MLMIHHFQRILIVVGSFVVVNAVNNNHEICERFDFARERHFHIREMVSMTRVRDHIIICRGSEFIISDR